MTGSQALERRNKPLRATSQRENTRLMGLALERLGALKLVAITPLHIRALLDSLSDYSHHTQLKVLQLVRSALEDAAALEVIPRNPASTVKPPRVQAQQHGDVWTLEQVDTFLEAAQKRRLYALFYFMLSTGLRIGEVLALERSSADLERRRLKVSQTVSGKGKDVELTPGKTPAARRTVPLSNDLVEVLTVWLERCSVEKEQAGTLWTEGNLLFPSSSGRALEYRNVLRDLKAIGQSAGLPKLSLHDLRRTYITLAVRQGISPEIVSKLAGHAGVRLTLEVYRRVSEEEAAGNVLKLKKDE